MQASSVQTLPSSQASCLPATQVPAVQASLSVHLLPSTSHPAPSARAENRQIADLTSHLSIVQEFWSSQTLGLLALQVPFMHWSAVQALSSTLHAPATAVLLQPDAASHTSRVQSEPSLQLAFVPGRHAPPLHTSPCVQALPSASQVVDSKGAASLTQVPVLTLQLSLVHGESSLQPLAGPLLQTPSWQRSPIVQLLPSSQELFRNCTSQLPP